MSRERAVDLLLDRAVTSLEPAEQAELSQLLDEHTDLDPEDFELAAAACSLAFLAPDLEPLPAGLRARLKSSVELMPELPGPREVVPRVPEPKGGLFRWAGWAVAAALLIFLWPTRTGGGSPSESFESMLARLDRGSSEILRLPWASTEDELGQSEKGEVLWDKVKGQGYMRFEGLEPNDPVVAQYQLWIFDKDRPQEHPVDGGVFDVAEGGALVPIDSKLAVHEATLFAVTLERPGGVVVSSRERLVLVAPVPAGG